MGKCAKPEAELRGRGGGGVQLAPIKKICPPDY